ncbi:MAG TPA: LysR family transcriptional regulator [Usitatibacteraceae bacterium]
MNFDLADLRAFVAVAKLGSFGGAARELHISQPALSRRIEKLENALGVRLFHRTTRKVDLTTIGREFSYRATELLNGLEQSLIGIRDVVTRVTGEVTIACMPSSVRFFLPEFLMRFHQLYPSIIVRIIDQGTTEVLATIARSEADFGLSYIGTQEPNLEFTPILREDYVLACRVDHPLAGKSKVSWAELQPFDFMTVTKASQNRLLLDMALTNVSARPRWFCEAQHVSTLVNLVEAGMGIAAVPRLAMPPDGHPTLVSVPLEKPTISRTIGLIRRINRPLSPAAQQLYDQFAAHARHQDTARKRPPRKTAKR